MGKLLIVDENMRTTVIEVNHYTLKTLGIKPEHVKQHKSFRQLNLEVKNFINK